MRKSRYSPRPEEQGSPWPARPLSLGGAVILIGLAIAAVFLFTSPPPPPSPSPARTSNIEFMKHGELWFLSADGKELARIDIEIAEDDLSREQGLMYRNEMAQHHGMLFVFEDEEFRSFWMKNTPLPLDILFVDGGHRIVTIHKNTTPFSEEEYRSSAPARYVVEVNAGFTDLFKIQVGDRIRWSRTPAG